MMSAPQLRELCTLDSRNVHGPMVTPYASHLIVIPEMMHRYFSKKIENAINTMGIGEKPMALTRPWHS
ncbi:hypothetical protein Tcan_05668 [Toxocara canis]|uniref:Uncharacterized protein n=1 Tax=Toxocara canis TaxID=6265 RepID=A0A0B2US43_TOXCA|nr:hypothetical protein Tcan_05668 [Toxocara canis]